MLGALIGAGANILGGILGSNSQEKAAKQNAALQREFAQNGIQWKVEDAKKAGIHPLAALGAQTSSFAPVSVGGDSLAAGISAAGQDVSRAIDATRSASGRIDAYNKTVQDLSLRRMGLENELLASQIAKIRQAGTPPPMPTAGDRYLLDGQADSGLIKSTPMERNTTNPGFPHQEAGPVSEIGFARTKAGGLAPMYSKDTKDRLEDDTLGMISWNIRNRIAPMFDVHGFEGVGDGNMYMYNPVTQEYLPVKMKRGSFGFPRYYR